MSIDRSIRLDVSVPDTGARAGEGFAPGQQREPDAQDRQRFRQALAGAPAQPPAEAPTQQAPQALQPFALFGAPPPATSAPAPQLPPAFDDMLTRLLVDDQHGSRQVRMELSEDVLPGVTVAIQEAEGRLQVDFICRVEASRLKLNAAAPQHAPQLAERLGRDVLLRVQTDDEEDPCLFEVAASGVNRR